MTCCPSEQVYKNKITKCMRIFSIHRDSDAVFHEESESVIGFKI